jgi:hypothetical protein
MRKFMGVAGVIAAVTMATAAHAVVEPFGGAKTGVDPLGQHWVASNTYGSSWGEPGLSLGTITFNPHNVSNSHGTFATEFDFIFLKGVTGAIKQALTNNYFDTRFEDVTTGTFWNKTFVSPQEVDFTAPIGTEIHAGDKFFVNVLFTGPVNTSKFSFAGLWTDVGVPEPGTWAMMIAGIALLGATLRRRQVMATA